MLLGINGNGDWICLVDSIPFLGVQGFPCSLPCLPFNEKIPRAVLVLAFLVRVDSLVIQDFSELPLSIPSFVIFNEVNDVVVRYYFLVLVVDSAFEANEVGIVF